MDRRKLGGYLPGVAKTSFYPTICLEECKSNYVNILVQFVNPAQCGIQNCLTLTLESNLSQSNLTYIAR